MKPVRFGRAKGQPGRGPLAPRDAYGKFEESYLLPKDETTKAEIATEISVALDLGLGGSRRPGAE